MQKRPNTFYCRQPNDRSPITNHTKQLFQGKRRCRHLNPSFKDLALHKHLLTFALTLSKNDSAWSVFIGARVCQCGVCRPQHWKRTSSASPGLSHEHAGYLFVTPIPRTSRLVSSTFDAEPSISRRTNSFRLDIWLASQSALQTLY